MAPLTCPVCAAPVRQGDLICINCGANLARREPPQQQYPPQQDQQGYPPQQGYQDPQQQGGYQDPQQGYQGRDQGYPPQDQQGYPPQQQGGYPPQQDQGYGGPQQDQGYGSQQQQGYPPQQQGYGGGGGGGYGPPGAPHMPPPPREPTMTGGESTAAFTPFCPHCGAEIPDVGNPVCVQCLRPLHDQSGGGGGPQQVNVVVTFSSGDLQVQPGQELVLGRDPVHSPVASTFSRFDNVSRRHATLGIDNGGQPWIRDERSTNGTFVNDRRLQPGEQTSLRDGDSVRLAADARGQVRVGR
jgi:FHA domain